MIRRKANSFGPWISLMALLIIALDLSTAFAPPRAAHHLLQQQQQHRFTIADTSTTTLFVAEKTSSTTILPPPTTVETGSKVRYLRDLMWVRETLEDCTRAEFAIKVDTEISSRRRKTRAVDYENLLTKLNRRIMDLGCEPKSESCNLEQITKLTPGKGMGHIAYSDPQRDDLFNRILQTRFELMERMVVQGSEVQEDPFSISLPEINIEIPKEEEASDAPGPKLYVRDDGTVDWDGALQDQDALKNFGTAVWARINGRDPGSLDTDDDNVTEEADQSSGRPTVTAKIEETEQIRRELERLEKLETDFASLEKDHLALLNSAITAGQAVANINLATLDPSLRRMIAVSSESLEKKREGVVYQRLIYELERIYTYLFGEMGNTNSKGYIPLQDRLNVAEFGLLESQIAQFATQMESGETFDPDVLAVVSDQVAEFKRRLGIDYFVSGVTFDREAILRWMIELLEKTRQGLAFYVKGCQLLWNDLVFATSLILRAVQGYTLKPREVRNLRRTIKDFFTFIPVVIILVIPLSPIGHVLVFGAIQRVFPDFFPSCFTERRQNLLQLYESAEYSEVTIKENFREQVTRFLEAFFFQLASSVKKMYANTRGDEGSPKQ